MPRTPPPNPLVHTADPAVIEHLNAINLVEKAKLDEKKAKRTASLYAWGRFIGKSLIVLGFLAGSLLAGFLISDAITLPLAAAAVSEIIVAIVSASGVMIWLGTMLYLKLSDDDHSLQAEIDDPEHVHKREKDLLNVIEKAKISDKTLQDEFQEKVESGYRRKLASLTPRFIALQTGDRKAIGLLLLTTAFVGLVVITGLAAAGLLPALSGLPLIAFTIATFGVIAAGMEMAIRGTFYKTTASVVEQNYYAALGKANAQQSFSVRCGLWVQAQLKWLVETAQGHGTLITLSTMLLLAASVGLLILEHAGVLTLGLTGFSSPVVLISIAVFSSLFALRGVFFGMSDVETAAMCHSAAPSTAPLGVSSALTAASAPASAPAHTIATPTTPLSGRHGAGLFLPADGASAAGTGTALFAAPGDHSNEEAVVPAPALALAATS